MWHVVRDAVRAWYLQFVTHPLSSLLVCDYVTYEKVVSGCSKRSTCFLTASKVVTFLLDGYCSTVQGLLAWFEVDLGFTKLLFIQIHVCVMCFFLIASKVVASFSHLFLLYSWFQIGRHIILRLFLKTINLVPSVPKFWWDYHEYHAITWY